MDLFAAFGVFLACVACCMVMGLPQFLALLVGLVCFFLVGCTGDTGRLTWSK